MDLKDFEIQKVAEANEDMGTGYDYFDKKDRYSLYDKYIANRLGINLDGKLALNQRHISGTVSNDEIYKTLNGIDLTTKYADEIESNSGILSGLSRALNHKTNGIWGLGSDNARFDTLNSQIVYATARALGNGKTTNEQLRDAKSIYSAGLKGKKENYARTAEALDQQVIFLENQIQNQLNKGYDLPQEVFKKLENGKNLVSALRAASVSGKLRYDYDAFVRESNGIKRYKKDQ